MSALAETVKKTRVRSSYRFHRLTTNRASAKSLQAQNPTLTDVQQRVLAELREDGISLVPFEELVADADLWAALERDMGAFAAEAEQEAASRTGSRKKDDFLIRRSRRDKAPLPIDSPFLRYGLSDAVLGVANAYLGLWSKLILVDQWYTVPSDQDASRIASQRWHRDRADQNIIKVFTYFSDVDEKSGPTEYVRGSAPGGRYGDLWPWEPLSDHDYPPQDELEASTAPEDRVAATGPRGTVVLCNTGGFHRGGFAQRPRVMSVFNYVSPASLETLTTRRFDVDRGGDAQLPPAAEAALA